MKMAEVLGKILVL